MNPHSATTYPSIESLPVEVQQRLADILDDYLAGLEKGDAGSAEDLIKAHPDLAEPLRACVDSLDFLYQASTSLRPPKPAAAEIGDASEKRLGDYRIVREIARGGMGIVYEAKQVSLDRQVALKVLPFAAVLDRKQIARFQNEARAAAQLHHPNIVPVYAVGCERGVHYYAMQYIDGQPLDVAIRELRSLAQIEPNETGAAQSTGIAEAAPAPVITEAAGQAETPERNMLLDATGDEPGEPPIDPLTGGSLHSTPATPHPSNESHAPSKSRPSGESRRSTSAGLNASTWRAFSTRDSLKRSDFFHSLAELGIQAAEGLQHAHEYGVVHRDIKPSNLLLDDAGKLWITDFGLARFRTDANLTATGDVMGTVRYMSPEQAAGHTGLIDQRTDVYSLGITLYELLTLREAFEGEDRQQIFSRIADHDPQAPRRINRAVPVDLETIVLKAIAKSPAQRYTTAGELADDLRHFIEGKPVTARRPGLLDRAGKWARRHRVIVAAAAVIMVLALAGFAVSTLLIARENGETKEALELAETKHRQAEANRAKAEEHLARAERHLRQARQVVDRFGALHAERLKDVPGTQQLRRDLLRDTLSYYGEFIRDAGDDPTLQVDLAVTHSKVAAVTEQLGDPQRALLAYGRAKEIMAALAADQPDEPQYQADLALYRNNMGLLLSKTGNTTAADTAYQQAIAIQTRLADDHPTAAKYRGDLALSLANLGLLQSQTDRPAEAEQSYRRAIDIRRQLVDEFPDDARRQWDLAVTFNNLSRLHAQTDPDRAEQESREALAIQQQLVERHPRETKYYSDLAMSFNNLGALQNHTGRTDEAIESYRQAIAIQEQLVRMSPHVVVFRRDLAVSRNNLGRVYSATQQPNKASESFQQAHAILEDLVDDYPRELNYRSSLGGVLNNLAMALEQLDRTDEALAHYETAITHQIFAYEQAPQFARFRDFLINHYVNYGRLLRSTDRWTDAARTSLARKELHPTDPEKLYRVATELALAAQHVGADEADPTAEPPAEKQEFADAAVATLEQALAAGFEGIEQISTDPDLESLRQHPGFAEVLQKITEKTENSRESKPFRNLETDDNQKG